MWLSIIHFAPIAFVVHPRIIQPALHLEVVVVFSEEEELSTSLHQNVVLKKHPTTRTFVNKPRWAFLAQSVQHTVSYLSFTHHCLSDLSRTDTALT